MPAPMAAGRDAAVRTFAQNLARVLERQRAQLALIEARDTALRSAQLKSEFVSNMSHEIRTPMTGVIGMLDLLRETTLTEDQKEYVEIAHNSANRLLTLVNDILDFSKIEAGKVALENIPLDVRGVITEVQSMLSVQAAKKELGTAQRNSAKTSPRASWATRRACAKF